ncbi:Germin-like protein subfamily 2 member [Thalictrum thalictroides]|uniref:Germin-like protein n=1 Tax=Thalictrum thalictroides TaxID=46969 RepID=A0A7J6VLQ4_THATH|nr:Germin-like protein subfamily 2 member [Thalictrum thalictroides]
MAAFFTAFFVVCAMMVGTVVSDPDMLQDICVADLASGVKVNGFVCKANATADDFFSDILDVGFLTTANVLYSKTIKQGEIFTFPKGLVHFQKNNGNVPAAVIAAFNSQLPGTQSIAATLFAANPPVPNNVLTKAFMIGNKEVDKIKSRLAPKK